MNLKEIKLIYLEFLYIVFIFENNSTYVSSNAVHYLHSYNQTVQVGLEHWSMTQPICIDHCQRVRPLLVPFP